MNEVTIKLIRCFGCPFIGVHKDFSLCCTEMRSVILSRGKRNICKTGKIPSWCPHKNKTIFLTDEYFS